jgi:hypothetical protein
VLAANDSIFSHLAIEINRNRGENDRATITGSALSRSIGARSNPGTANRAAGGWNPALIYILTEFGPETSDVIEPERLCSRAATANGKRRGELIDSREHEKIYPGTVTNRCDRKYRAEH